MARRIRRTARSRPLRGMAHLPLAGAALALGAAALGPVGVGERQLVAASGSLTFTGFGVGGGSGASQFGEIGWASQGHATYQQILGTYYGGTTLGSAPDTAVRVWLTEATGQPVTLVDASGMVVGGTSVPANVPVTITDEGGTMVAQVGNSPSGCSSPSSWSTLLSVPGSVWISPPSLPPIGQEVSEPAQDALEWCSPNGTLAFRGQLQVLQDPQGQQVLVNQVGLESYVLGVVANEMPVSWATLGGGGPQGQDWGFQALEAQAVEARTYALAVGNQYGFASICDTPACQVYRGVNAWLPSFYRGLAEQAVADTAHQVLLTPQGSPAFTQYSASDGGYTAPGAFPAVADPYDAGCYGNICNPWNPWTQVVSLGSLAAAFPQVGTPTGLVVTARNGLGQDGGRVEAITVQGTAGSVGVSGMAFANALGLPSSWFVVSGPLAITNDAGGTTTPSPAPSPPPPTPAPVDTSGVEEVTPAGSVVATDGATSLGDVGTLGLTGLGGSHPLAAPVVGLTPTPDGKGYWLVAADGGVFTFGDAGFFGNTYTAGYSGLGGSHPLPAKAVALVATPDGKGYWIALANGQVLAFGDAPTLGSVPLDGSSVVGAKAYGDGVVVALANGAVNVLSASSAG